MRRLIPSLIVITVGTWLFGLWYEPPATNARAWTHEIYFLNGVLAWTFMAFCLVTAARPAWLERVTKTSLDQLYVNHRVLGWWALGLSFFHYYTKPIVIPIIRLFELPNPPKIPAAENQDLWDIFWKGLRPVANVSAEWLTWIMLGICLLALIRALGYTRWLHIHKLLSIVFLGLTLHCVRLMETSDFMTPFGWWNLLVTVVGSWAAIRLLLNHGGIENRAEGTLVYTETTGNVTRWHIQTELAKRIEPGQFVFVTLNEERHPFSVAQTTDQTITLMIKHLGDFTSSIVPKVTEGTQITIEGPYGVFRPVFDGSRQTWVATGIGIAPFVAWLQAAKDIKPKGVTLHWCIKDASTESQLAEVQRLCEESGITLKLHESHSKRATVDEILADRPERLVVCGNVKLAKALRKAWDGKENHFQTESFNWRHAS